MMPLYWFCWGVCAREAFSWVPCGAPDTLVGVPRRSLGALPVLFLCFVEDSRCSPCFVLSGVGRDVRSIHACFARARKSKRLTSQTLFGHLGAHKRGKKKSRRAREGPRVAPETLDSYQNVPKPPTENQQKTKSGTSKTQRKPRLRMEHVNKHWGNVKSESEFFVGSGRARGASKRRKGALEERYGPLQVGGMRRSLVNSHGNSHRISNRSE